MINVGSSWCHVRVLHESCICILSHPLGNFHVRAGIMDFTRSQLLGTPKVVYGRINTRLQYPSAAAIILILPDFPPFQTPHIP